MYPRANDPAICNAAEVEVLRALEGIDPDLWPTLACLDGDRYVPSDLDDFTPDAADLAWAAECFAADAGEPTPTISVASIPPSAYGPEDCEYPDNPLW